MIGDVHGRKLEDIVKSKLVSLVFDRRHTAAWNHRVVKRTTSKPFLFFPRDNASALGLCWVLCRVYTTVLIRWAPKKFSPIQRGTHDDAVLTIFASPGVFNHFLLGSRTWALLPGTSLKPLL